MAKEKSAKVVKAKSGKDVLKIAGKALKEPGAISTEDIQSLAGSVVSQAEDIRKLQFEINKLKKANRPVRGN